MPRLLFVLTCVTLQRLSLWVAPMGSRALWISVGCGQWEVPTGDQKAERACDCIIYFTGSLPVGSLRLTVTLLWRPQLLPMWSFPSQIPEPLPPQSFGCRSGYSSTILALTFCAIHPGFLQPAQTFINSPFIKPLSWWGSASCFLMGPWLVKSEDTKGRPRRPLLPLTSPAWAKGKLFVGGRKQRLDAWTGDLPEAPWGMGTEPKFRREGRVGHELFLSHHIRAHDSQESKILNSNPYLCQGIKIAHILLKVIYLMYNFQIHK